MKHCKIIKCRVSVYRCGLCLGHYLAWLDTGAMPGETRAKPQEEDDVYIKRSALSQLRNKKDKEIAQLRAELDAANARITQRESETTQWRDQAMQLLEALNRMRVERDTAVAEQHRLFRGMANAGRELDAANARIAELERQLGETQAALGAVEASQ